VAVHALVLLLKLPISTLVFFTVMICANLGERAVRGREIGPIAVMRATLVLAALLVAVPALAQPAFAPAPAGGLEAPIGKILSVSGVVTIEHAVAVVLQANLPGGTSQAKTGDFVFQGDVVQTGVDGKLALAFGDGSAFNLSSNGRLVLDSFIYDPNSKSTSNSSLISLTKGSVTFVSGAIARTGDMRVDTPVGTMGIRGTTPRIDIAPDGSVKFSTLVEGKKDTSVIAPAGSQPNITPRRRQAAAPRPTNMSPEQAATYNRLLRFDTKICGNC
jgi:hypothetical protein